MIERIKSVFQKLISKWKAYREQHKKTKEWMYLGGKSAFKTTEDILSERFSGYFGKGK